MPEIVASSENVAAPVTVVVPSKVASPSTLKSLRVVTVPEVFQDLIDQKKSHHIEAGN